MGSDTEGVAKDGDWGIPEYLPDMVYRTTKDGQRDHLKGKARVASTRAPLKQKPALNYKAAGIGFFASSALTATAAEWVNSQPYVRCLLFVALIVSAIATAEHYKSTKNKTKKNSNNSLAIDFYIPMILGLLFGAIVSASLMPLVPHSSMHYKSN